MQWDNQSKYRFGLPVKHMHSFSACNVADMTVFLFFLHYSVKIIKRQISILTDYF